MYFYHFNIYQNVPLTCIRFCYENKQTKQNKNEDLCNYRTLFFVFFLTMFSGKIL